MAQVITGYAGCGKTYELIKRIDFLIENHICEPHKILVLTSARNKETYSGKHREITVWFFDELSKFILKKNPSFIDKTYIPDYISTTIIGEICKDKFANNPELNSLTKSETFFRELYNLFCIFKTNKISPDFLKETITKITVNPDDKTRLSTIAEVFNGYENILNDNCFLDVRDIETFSLKAIKESELLVNTLKSRFKYIFADGLENISEPQLEIIKTFADYDKLCVTFDEYSQIREFRGAIDTKKLKAVFKNFDECKLTESKRNNEILQRALYLISRYNETDLNISFEKSEKINYMLFENTDEEIKYIANDIKEKIKKNNSYYSDFAVLVRDYNEKQKFADIFLTENIPVKNATEDNDFKNFMLQFSRYIDIFTIFDKFGLKYFSPEELKKVKLPSKTDTENLFNELNLYFENILSEILENIYTKDSFLSIMNIQNRYSLMNVVYENQKILTEKDKASVATEFDFIKKAYELHKNGRYTELAVLSAKRNPRMLKNNTFTECLGKLTSKINEICNLYENILKKPLNLSLFKNLSVQTQQRQSEKENTVNLLTFFKTGGEEYKYVYIPCLTENNFPKKNKSTYFISFQSNQTLSEEIRKTFPSFSKITEEYSDGIKEEIRLFYTGLTRAKKEILISTHTFEDKKQVPPSVFLPALLDKEGIKPENTKKDKKEIQNIIEITDEEPESEEKEPILGENETIKMSASSVGNYQMCPKKFYFANLLNLKTSETFAASYGTIVHAVFEVFNKNRLDDYNKETVLNLSRILFNAKSNPEEAMKNGFSKLNIDLINATDDLSLDEMKKQFDDAVNCLDKNAFFTDVPDKVETEKNFRFKLEEIPNVIFSGRIDAIYKKNNSYEIVDYKTGHDKQNDLDYYISKNGVNFLTKTGGEPKENAKDGYISNYQYQIPLYYLASVNATELNEFNGKIKNLMLRYVRPQTKDTGSRDDKISAEEIEQFKEKIIKNLKETIIDKIRNSTEFNAKKSYGCKNCEFTFICDKEDEDDD